jgi:predicted RNase H-like HicB family nuclease
MKKLIVPIRIVFYRDESDWVAHCLEFDLIGDGLDRQTALSRLMEAMSLQLEASIEHDNPDNLFKPAEGKFFRMFFEGEDTAVGQVHLDSDWLTIDEIEAREYPAPGTPSDAEMVVA